MVMSVGYPLPAPQERFPSTMPLLWIEILSADDKMVEVWEKARHVVQCGSPYVWIINPNTLESELRTSAGVNQIQDKNLRLPDSPTVVPLLSDARVTALEYLTMHQPHFLTLRAVSFAPSSALAFSFDATNPPSFEADIQPIVTAKCVMCHGPAPPAKLDLRTQEAILKGGVSGAVVVPGAEDKSLLLTKVITRQTPPGNAELTDSEIEQIRADRSRPRPACNSKRFRARVVSEILI
jgi:hypothetical protein